MSDLPTDSEETASPAERRRARTRELILSAAEKVFREEGEAGLSIRRLADEINYSPAAIYKYFGSKAELVEELKQAFFERFNTRLAAVMTGDRPFMDTAVGGVEAYVLTAIERPHHYTAAFSGEAPQEMAPHASPEREQAFGESPAGQAFNTLEGMIAEGVALGVFHRHLDVDLAAKSVWASCHGLAMLIAHLPCYPDMKGHPASGEQTAFIRHHAELLIAGLVTGPSSLREEK
jgi:AcrR family transcriptional regulator